MLQLATRGGEWVLVEGESSPVRVSVFEVGPAPQLLFHSREGAPFVYLDTKSDAVRLALRSRPAHGARTCLPTQIY